MSTLSPVRASSPGDTRTDPTRMLLGTAVLLVASLCAPLAESAIIRVDQSASGVVQDGTSWTTAYRHLQDALANAIEDDEIWVAHADGLPYLPDRSVSFPSGTQDRTASFALRPRVALYGGFAGDELVREARSPADHPTVLSGDLSQNDSVADVENFLGNTSYSDNSYTVVSAISQPGQMINALTVLDGFIIRGGSADASPSSPPSNATTLGGGLLLGLSADLASSPTIRACRFVSVSRTPFRRPSAGASTRRGARRRGRRPASRGG